MKGPRLVIDIEPAWCIAFGLAYSTKYKAVELIVPFFVFSFTVKATE